MKTILSSLNIPVYPDGQYDESCSDYVAGGDYITHNLVLETPVLVSDDEDQAEESIYYVHYFTKGDPTTKKATIKSLLRAAGYNILNLQQSYETDTKYTHVVIEVSIDGVI